MAPGELYVKRYVRPKYVKKNGEGVIIDQLPARPLPKAMAGAGLLAQVVIDKYSGAVSKMMVGPSKSAYRSRLQISVSCKG